MDRHPQVIGIAGASGSGKSALCSALHERLGPRTSSLVEMDRYYHDQSHLPPDAREALNFDRPEMLDVPLLVAHLCRLRRGDVVLGPTYDFATHTRQRGRPIFPAPVILVEGIFCLVFPELRRLLSWSVFVAAPDSVRLERRLARDVGERGRDPRQVHEQYARDVRPAAEQQILPSAIHASQVVIGTRPLDALCSEVLGRVGTPIAKSQPFEPKLSGGRP